MLYYITENPDKITSVKRNLKGSGIKIQPKAVELLEIQSANVEKIIQEKAKYAFSIIKKPLIVNDASWEITALGGFPGPYMKYVNKWLHAFDIINLMSGHLNREVFFNDNLYYIDEKREKLFSEKVSGEVLMAPKGKSRPSDEVFTFRKDKKTIASCINDGLDSFDGRQKLWQEFADWYQSEIISK